MTMERKPFLSSAFWHGFSRALDISGSMRDYSFEIYDNGLESDYDALKEDWVHVGEDIKEASSRYAEASKESSTAEI